MAIYQILVRLLDGRTQCLQLPSPTISGETLKHHLSLQTLIPPPLLRLVAGTLEIQDQTLISASAADHHFPSLTLLLRLRGGKGGFGSLLRGAATKAGQKKTNNFDACRDMSGRRLRHVNAEKRLEEWKAEAGDRRLEKMAEDFLKKKAKEVKKGKGKEGEVEKYLEKYREDSAKCMEAVVESVRESFTLYKDSKRKALPSARASASKRAKIWIGKQTVGDSDSDSDDEIDDNDDIDGCEDKPVVLDDGNGPSQSKKDAERSTLHLVSGVNFDGESSGGGSEERNSEEVSGNSLEVQASPTCSEQSNMEEANGSNGLISPAVGQGSGTGDGSSESDGFVESETRETEVSVIQNAVVSTLEEVPERVETKPAADESVKLQSADKEPVAQMTACSTSDEPLCFDKYNLAAELEVLGLERLKSELQSHGLKCGGTLQERAARLFLLKSTPLDKLPKKVLAAKAAGK
ncbi:putative protein SDE2-like protein [Iris pallida]|uniref:Sde2 N-terminal ubiquitin domain-containing protein n=1 Tax=Iris pallida TaxID=29817 RepID=A0AAX6ESB3_IRIPA|nr:putative protein SDE2-like protein [Iris pallida]